MPILSRGGQSSFVSIAKLTKKSKKKPRIEIILLTLRIKNISRARQERDWKIIIRSKLRRQPARDMCRRKLQLTHYLNNIQWK